MICPLNQFINFDDIGCQNCQWYLQCKKYQYQEESYEPDNNFELPSFIVNGECQKNEETICNLGYACDGCPYNRKNKELSPTDKIVINSLAKEIEMFGENLIWENINTIENIEKRLQYIEYFLSAKNLLSTGEY